MILVAGGTGRLGRLVVHELLQRQQPVRVLTRSAARAGELSAAGAEVVVGDVRRPESLPAAFTAVRTVVSAVQGFAGPGGVSPASVDRDGNANLVSAARTVGADVVLVSVVDVSARHPMELFRMKAAAEQNLRHSGSRWTIVRADAFRELFEELLANGPGGRPLVFGRGDNPLAFVPISAVAAAVVQAAVDPAQRGRVLEVPGTERLTMNELARRVRPDVAPRHVPRWLLRALSRLGPAAVRRQTAAALVMDGVGSGPVSAPGAAGASRAG